VTVSQLFFPLHTRVPLAKRCDSVADFKEYFEQYGKVLYGEVMFNRETHKSRGFGFIIFESEDSVDRVCEQSEHAIREKAVEVKRAIPRSQMPVSTGTGGSSPTSSTPASASSTSKSLVNSQMNITSPIRPAARRVATVSGNVSTMLVGNSMSGTTPIKKPASMSSYAAALLQGGDLGNGFDLSTSEIEAPTTGRMSSYDHNMNIDYTDDLVRPQKNRAYSEPIVQVKGSFSGGGYLNSLYDTDRDFPSSNNFSNDQAFHSHELRPPSLSFDYTFNSLVTRPSADSPPIAWSQVQHRSHVPSAEAIGTINNVLGLNWLSPSASIDQSSPNSQSLQQTSSLDSSSYLSNLRAQDFNSTYSSQSSLGSLGFSSSPRIETWANLVSKSQPSPISPPRNNNYAMSPTSPQQQYYPSSPSQPAPAQAYHQGYPPYNHPRAPVGYPSQLSSLSSHTGGLALRETKSLDNIDYSLGDRWLSGRKT
jgi:RNA recognition motif-containing protein